MDEKARKIRLLLIESARQNKPRAYGELMAVIGLHHSDPDDRRTFSQVMETISRFEDSQNKRPMLSAAVFFKGAVEIGGGFYKLAESLGFGPRKKLEEDLFEFEMLKRCHSFWTNEEHYRKFREPGGSSVKQAPGADILTKTDTPSNSKIALPEEVPDKFKGHDIDWLELTKENMELGSAGEQLVLAYEKEVLTAAGRNDLAEAVQKVQDGLGYDILSYYIDGGKKFIEVKTTGADKAKAFPITAREVAFSRQHPETYHLYRIFQFRADKKPIEFYECKGVLDSHFQLEPKVYLAKR